MGKTLRWATVLLALLFALSLMRTSHASTYTVSNTNDSGAGSLRQAILDANNHTGPDTISFNISGCSGVCTISLSSALPALTGGQTTINGYSQPGSAPATSSSPATLLVEIDGTGVAGDVDGLHITSYGNTIRGLVLHDFDSAVRIEGAAGNAISGNYIGTDATGSSAQGNQIGVRISGQAQSNTIGGDEDAERNVISGNVDGVKIDASGAVGNTIAGNYIGPAANSSSLGNTGRGIVLGSEALGNTIANNRIRYNGEGGVWLENGARNNTIGGDRGDGGNEIVENGHSGVFISGSNSTRNHVQGNYVYSNDEYGIFVNGAQQNTVGGERDSTGNTVVRNGWDGVCLAGTTTISNTVSGNYIGWVSAGVPDPGNGHNGVYLRAGAHGNTIGGDMEAEGNVIVNNAYHGVCLDAAGTSDNVVSGNYIGVIPHPWGEDGAGNGQEGIRVSLADNNTIGPQNVVSYNEGHGIYIYIGDGNTIRGNLVGTDIAGTHARANGGSGIYIGVQSKDNTVGGSEYGQANVISGNDSHGVYIAGSGTTGNVVQGNYIGVDLSGTKVLGNHLSGIRIDNGASNNTIGGSQAGQGNIIGGNGNYGLYLAASSHVVGHNFVGTNAYDANLSNDKGGIVVEWGQQNEIGPANVVAFNDGPGIHVVAGTQNYVFGNYVGTDEGVTKDLGNKTYGIQLSDATHHNTIGGDEASERNIIAHNSHGVYITGEGTDANTISGNYIGTGGGNDMGNTWAGVVVTDGAQDNAIGGSSAAEGNVISGNGFGIVINSAGTTGNTVAGNYVGLAAGGTASLSNSFDGVVIASDATDNTIGPDNIIAHNNWDGVHVKGNATARNVVTGNSIHHNDLGIHLEDGANGGIAAPTVDSTTAGSYHISGTACAGCSVELFSNGDNDGEGETYLGATTADGSGDYVLTIQYLTQSYLTATATGAVKGTSQFSAAYLVSVNLSPIADAGPDQSVAPGDLVILDGSTSSDPDGNVPLAYTWTQTGGPSVTLSNATASQPTFTAPASPATLSFDLVVHDALGAASAPDTVGIVVGGGQFNHAVYLPLLQRQGQGP